MLAISSCPSLLYPLCGPQDSSSPLADLANGESVRCRRHRDLNPPPLHPYLLLFTQGPAAWRTRARTARNLLPPKTKPEAEPIETKETHFSPLLVRGWTHGRGIPPPPPPCHPLPVPISHPSPTPSPTHPHPPPFPPSLSRFWCLTKPKWDRYKHLATNPVISHALPDS